MATSNPPRGAARRISIAGIIILTITIAGALALTPSPASADANLELNALEMTGINHTLDGNLSDIQITATIDYSYDVPDATRRIVKLQAGPTEDDLDTVTFRQDRNPTGEDSGSVGITASLFDSDAFDREGFAPPVAGVEESTVVVRAVVEIRREGGDPVVAGTSEWVTVELHDDATLQAAVGGVVGLSVVEES